MVKTVTAQIKTLSQPSDKIQVRYLEVPREGTKKNKIIISLGIGAHSFQITLTKKKTFYTIYDQCCLVFKLNTRGVM